MGNGVAPTASAHHMGVVRAPINPVGSESRSLRPWSEARGSCGEGGGSMILGPYCGRCLKGALRYWHSLVVTLFAPQVVEVGLSSLHTIPELGV